MKQEMTKGTTQHENWQINDMYKSLIKNRVDVSQ